MTQATAAVRNALLENVLTLTSTLDKSFSKELKRNSLETGMPMELSTMRVLEEYHEKTKRGIALKSGIKYDLLEGPNNEAQMLLAVRIRNLEGSDRG